MRCKVCANVVVASLLATFAHAAPHVPASDDVVLLTFERSDTTTRPASPVDLLRAAQRHMVTGRASLHERHFGRAEALLLQAAPCLATTRGCDTHEASDDLRLTYADVLQHRHEFVRAEQVLDEVLRTDRVNPQARLIRAMVRLARGRAVEAERDCAVLIGQVDALVASACLAQSLANSGRLREGHTLLVNTLRERIAGDEQGAWAFGVLAELEERLGSSNAAIAAMEVALRGDESSGTLRIRAADLLLRANRNTAALEALRELPTSEPVILRRAIAAKRLRAPEFASLAHQWQRAKHRNEKLGSPIHDGDAALGELELAERAETALLYAQRNWSSGQELDAARLLLRAAIVAKRPEIEQQVLDWMARERIEDAVSKRLHARVGS